MISHHFFVGTEMHRSGHERREEVLRNYLEYSWQSSERCLQLSLVRPRSAVIQEER